MKKIFSIFNSSRFGFLFDFILLGGLFWVARYWQSAAFGLYEDDLTIIPTAFSMGFGEVLRFVFNYIIHLYGHARPLSDSFIFLFSNIGWKINGLWGAYLIGYAITLTNILLFYWLLKRLGGRFFALLGGIVYCLFSADTTQVFLTHSLGLQPSITLLLLAFHSYISNRKVLAYILAGIILFSYESPFLVFMAAPFLEMVAGRKNFRRIAIHVVILSGMLGLVYLLRTFIGEGRVESLNIRDVLTIPFRHMIQGPFTVLRTFLTRPLRPLVDFSLPLGVAMGITFVVLIIILWRQESILQVRFQDLLKSFQKHAPILPEDVKKFLYLTLSGLIMLVMAYPLTFTVDATSLAGRATRVHAAAVVGSALFFSSLLIILMAVLRRRLLQRVLMVVVSLYFSLMVGYGFILQEDYVLAWKLQKSLWTELLPLIPDAGPGTAILLTPTGLTDVYQIDANSWNMPRILEQLYLFPDSTLTPPAVYRLSSGWKNTILAPDGSFQIDGIAAFGPSTMYGNYRSSAVILIDTSGDHLVRQTEPVILSNDVAYPLKTNSDPILPLLQHGLLYNLLISAP
jgi:hypothetical protein